MSRLSKLYQTMENLKELGLSINEDLIQEANELEEEIIKKEILPVLSKTIEPALQPVTCFSCGLCAGTAPERSS